MAEQKLNGKRVAIIATDMVEQVELTEPRKALDEAGATTELLSIKPGKIQGFTHYEKGDQFPVDRLIEEADAGEYDALLIPGGVGNPDTMRMHENASSSCATSSTQASRSPSSVTARGCSSRRTWSAAGASRRGLRSTPTSAMQVATGSTRRSSSTTASSRAASRTTSRPSTRR